MYLYRTGTEENRRRRRLLVSWPSSRRLGLQGLPAAGRRLVNHHWGPQCLRCSLDSQSQICLGTTCCSCLALAESPRRGYNKLCVCYTIWAKHHMGSFRKTWRQGGARAQHGPNVAPPVAHNPLHNPTAGEQDETSPRVFSGGGTKCGSVGVGGWHWG